MNSSVSFNWHGVKALITGGASGLGAAVATEFARRGATLTLLDRDTEAGTALAEQIGAAFASCDVTDGPSVEATVQKAAAEMGGLTACVNCAGVVIGEKTWGQRKGAHDLQRFAAVQDVNLIGSFNVARCAAAEIARMPTDSDGLRGVILHTSSIAAQDGQEGQVAYAASKGGVLAMTLPMARDLAPHGIRVMSIAPGVFHTPMMASLPADVQAELAAEVPCPKRLGRPEEFARAAAFILECPYLNGTTIRLDGALRMG